MIGDALFLNLFVLLSHITICINSHIKSYPADLRVQYNTSADESETESVKNGDVIKQLQTSKHTTTSHLISVLRTRFDYVNGCGLVLQVHGYHYISIYINICILE